MNTETARTYGGWRERQGFGVAGMDGPRTGIALAAVVATLLVGMFSTTGMLVMLPVLAVGGIGALGSLRGEPLAHLAGRHLAWRLAAARGWTSHRAGQGRPPGAEWTLPGPLATTMLISSIDDTGAPWAAVWDRRSGRLTATLLVSPISTWLVDPGEADRWVANWHHWLAKLGYSPMLRYVAVTIETTPAGPAALQAAVRPRLADDAPPAARELMEQLLAAAPAASAAVSTRVSITIDPARAGVPLESLEEQVAEFSRLLTGMTAGLPNCGVAVQRRATLADTVKWVRGAFDPASRDHLAAGPTSALNWGDASPVAAEEGWDTYQADSGHSITWGWDEAPRQAVTSDVLARLISPGRYGKRVTLLLTPYPAQAAAQELDRQAQAAVFRAQVKTKSGRDRTARELTDEANAKAAAAQEAQGAGLVGMALYVTATVPTAEELPAAAADVENRAGESRIRLRRLYGGQAVGFATGLSAGVNPETLRSWL